MEPFGTFFGTKCTPYLEVHIKAHSGVKGLKKFLIRENFGSQHVYEFSEKDFIKNMKTDKVILNDFSGAPACAKRACSGAPWVRKFGKPSIPENLVMT